MKAVARVLLFLSALPSPTEPCDVCDGIASRKINSGEVLEINDAGLERLAPAHSMLAILLYKPYDAKTERMQRAFDDVASALKADGLLDKCVLAQIDAETFPRAAASLHVEAVEMPAIRLVRGDAAFGYPLRAGGSVAELLSRLRIEISRRDAPAAKRLLPEELSRLESDGNGTRVLVRASRQSSLRAVEQVAHALHGAVTFALPASPSDRTAASLEPLPPPPVSPLSPPPPPSEAPPSSSSSPPSSSSSSVLSPERVRLLREVSPDLAGEVPALEMPTHFADVDGGYPLAHGVGGVSARQLYRWVRWAALPSVFALTPSSATTYLVEGASGIAFVKGVDGSNKTRDFVVRRLRRIAERMRLEGEHGLWLLYADPNDAAHARLRLQLGLGGQGAATTTSSSSSSSNTPPAASNAAGTSEKESGGEFAIIVMAGGRILERFVMPPPFTFDAVHAFSSAFVRGELLGAKRKWEALRVYGLAALGLVALVGGWPVWSALFRWCCRGAPTQVVRSKKRD